MKKPVIRPYTPISDVDQKGTVDFIIKKYPDGPMSEHMHNLEPGQRLDIKGPIPKYQWSPNKQLVSIFSLTHSIAVLYTFPFGQDKASSSLLTVQRLTPNWPPLRGA